MLNTTLSQSLQNGSSISINPAVIERMMLETINNVSASLQLLEEIFGVPIPDPTPSFQTLRSNTSASISESGLLPYYLDKRIAKLMSYLKDFPKEQREFWEWIARIVIVYGLNQQYTGSFQVNLQEEEDQYILEAEIVGVNKRDIKVFFEDDYLTISVKRVAKKTEPEANFLIQEIPSGKLSRRFLFKDIDQSKIEASYQKNLLRLELPKAEPAPEDLVKIK